LNFWAKSSAKNRAVELIGAQTGIATQTSEISQMEENTEERMTTRNSLAAGIWRVGISVWMLDMRLHRPPQFGIAGLQTGTGNKTNRGQSLDSETRAGQVV